MSLLIVAFPKLDPVQFKWIQIVRAQCDEELFKIIEPHFTIVFPVDDLSESEFIQIAENSTGNIQRIEFELNKVVLHADPLTGRFMQFFVPDKGYDEIMAMHDRIYAGAFKKYLRTNLPYIPHITIGNHANAEECRESVDHINSLDMKIAGSIETLTVVKFIDKTILPVKNIQLEE